MNLRSIELLMNDHRVIEKALQLLENSVIKLQQGKNVDRKVFETLITFFKLFADRCHHGKEESAFFPTLERLGIPKEGGPIGVMLYEHDMGRRYIKNLEDSIEKFYSGDASALQDIVENAYGYINLLRNHIFKEDNILFQLATQVLDYDTDRELVEEFERIEEERIGHGKHEELIRSINDLESILIR
ncbi:MAG: hemerythrin domain-containing protein [Ignisphaera sp.]